MSLSNNNLECDQVHARYFSKTKTHYSEQFKSFCLFKIKRVHF